MKNQGFPVFFYWEDEEITYIPHSSGTNLISLILNKEGISLNCGLKTGMTEAENPSLGLPFQKFIKEELFDKSKSIALDSNVIRDEKDPISLENFDSLYVYVGSIPEEDMVEYGISPTSCVSIMAFIKDETVTEILLDLPTAG